MDPKTRVAIRTLTCLEVVPASAPGCLTAGRTEPVTIEVGSFFAPPEAESWLYEEIAAFERNHPEIEVRTKDLRMPERQRFETHDDYFGPDVEHRLAANVVGIDSLNGYLVPYLVEQNQLVAIDDLEKPDDSFEFTDFHELQFDSVRYRHKTWGVPWLAWDSVLVLDWDLFEQAGIREPPRTWTEFVADAAKLRRDTNGDGRIDQWGIRFKSNDDTSPYLLLSMVIQRGGTIMRDGRFDASDPAVKLAFEFANDLAFEWDIGRIDSRSMDDVLNDRSVRYAMHLVTNHDLGSAVSRPNFRVAPVPTFTGEPRSYAHERLYFGVRRSTRRQEEASWKFVQWMTRKDVSLPPVLAGFPARKDFTSRADFQDLVANKIQDARLIFDVCATGEDSLDQVFDRASGLERYWQNVSSAIQRIDEYEPISQRAVDQANRAIGEWYSGD